MPSVYHRRARAKHWLTFLFVNVFVANVLAVMHFGDTVQNEQTIQHPARTQIRLLHWRGFRGASAQSTAGMRLALTGRTDRKELRRFGAPAQL
jgi:hypothetical protein